MKRFLKMLPILIAALVFYTAMPVQHFAEPMASPGIVPPMPIIPDVSSLLPTIGSPSTSAVKTLDANGNSTTCAGLPEAKGGALLGMMMPCIIYTIQNSTIVFSKQMISWLSPIMWSFLALVVALFGVKLLQGEQQAPKQAFLLVVKITFVTTFLMQLPTYFIPQTYAMMNEGVNMATSALTANQTGIGCNVDDYGNANIPLVWKQMDCVVGKLYGFSTGTNPITGEKTTNMLLASSAFGLLAGFAFGGTVGVAVFFAMIGVLVSVVEVVIRMCTSFLTGYMTVCFLLILAPLFMPLVFLKITEGYFEKWWKAILGGLLLPVIIASYSTIALLVYDKLLFEPDSIMQTLFQADVVKKALENPRAPCNSSHTNNPNFEVNSVLGTNKFAGGDAALNKDVNDAAQKVDENSNPQQVASTMDTLAKNPFTGVFVNPLLSMSNDACGMFRVPQFDITKMDSKYTDKNGPLDNLFFQAIKLFLMSYLMMLGLEATEDTYASLTGGSSIGSSLIKAMAVTETIKQGIQNLQQNLNYNMQHGKDADGNDKDFGPGGASGADFMRNLPGAIGHSTASTLGGFLGGVNRK